MRTQRRPSASRSFVAEVEPRWAMEYAAALGETDDRYFDTRRPDGVDVHPLFPVCLEWEAQQDLWRAAGLGPDEVRAIVHYGHDLTLMRALRGGDRLDVTGVVVAATPHRAGTLLTTRFEATDAGGPVWRSRFVALVREASFDLPPAAEEEPVPVAVGADGGVADRLEVDVPAQAAQVYTACSRIWNPIHTDTAVATAAGLPAPLLHGTATLGLAVSKVVAVAAAGDPTRVGRISGRFGAMVVPPCTLAVELHEPDFTPTGTVVAFAVRTEDGSPAVRDGLIALR